ncbi:hypothetical protein Tsubulata_027483, partial [Turnera subulata]
LNNPSVLKKGREELDIRVGKYGLAEESDFPELQYLHNIVFENFRLNPVFPILVPHSPSRDCTIGGYNVP